MDPDDDESRSVLSTLASMKRLKIKKPFSYCKSNIGELGIGRDPSQLNQLELELGVGMTLYFRQLKLFTLMFFIFTVLSIPQFYIYYSQFNLHQSN